MTMPSMRGERVALEEHAVGEGAAVALVGVAERRTSGRPRRPPPCATDAGGEPAPPRPRRPDATSSSMTSRAPASACAAARRARRASRQSSQSSGSMTPMRWKVMRFCDASHGISSTTPTGSVVGRVAVPSEAACVEQRRDVEVGHRPVADRDRAGDDLDERLAPEQAPREPLRTTVTSMPRAAAPSAMRARRRRRRWSGRRCRRGRRPRCSRPEPPRAPSRQPRAALRGRAGRPAAR